MYIKQLHIWFKSYVDQIISNIINYYNSILTIVYNKITILEA